MFVHRTFGVKNFIWQGGEICVVTVVKLVFGDPLVVAPGLLGLDREVQHWCLPFGVDGVGYALWVVFYEIWLLFVRV